MTHFKNKIRSRLTSRSVEALFLLLRTQKFLNRNLLIYLVLVCLFSSCGGFQEQKFAMEPQDQTAIVGTRVTLPCRVERKSGQLQWTKDDFGLGLHRDLSGYDRYRMIGSDEEGDYSLDIREVALEDDAKYQCQVSSGPNGEPPIRSRYAKLNVLVPPDPPKIVQGNFLSIHESTKVTLECISAGGKPPAEITWVDGNAGVITNGVTYSVEPMNDGQRFTARSIMKFSPTEAHNNQTYSCQAQNTADRAYRSDSIRIEVLYAPKIKILAQGKSMRVSVKEGENVTIECNAHGNPSNLTYKIYIDGVFTTTDSSTVIHNVSRSHHGVPVKCEVSNDMGRSDDTEVLSVSYAPKFRNMPHEVEGEIDASVTVVCNVDTYPVPEFEWLHQELDRNIRVAKTQNLTVTLNTETTGKYICRATVPGYPPVEAETNLFIKGPPKILSNSTQMGTLGDTVKVVCAVFAIPRIESIVWTFNGKEIDTMHDQDYAFQEDLHHGGITNSTLIIRESQSKHFGLYTCNVTNEYGSDLIEISLRQNKSFPLLLILFGATSITILFAAIILLVVICQRKQRNTKQNRTKKPDVTVTAEELYKENDRNSNISDFKMELRQANGNCEVDYSNNGSDSTLCSNAKLGSGIPLAGSVPITAINQNKAYQPYRYSNDYSDTAFSDFKINGYNNGYHTYVHYGQDPNPGSLRVQSPSHSSDKLTPNRSTNGSLPRSADSTSTIHFNPAAAVGSQSSSLQRPVVKRECNGDVNTVGIAGPTEVSRIPNGGLIPTVDVRYAATYGNPHLRTGGGGLGYASQVNTAKPASTPAPPPYSSVRNSVIMPTGISSHSLTSPPSLASPQCATSPITNSTLSDSSQPQVGATNSLVTPQSPSAHYILAPSNRSIGNTTVTKKGNSHQSPLATHV